jgi:hypothetical protein
MRNEALPIRREIGLERVTTGASTPRIRALSIIDSFSGTNEYRRNRTSNPPTNGFAVANIPIHNFAFILLTFFRPSHRKKFRLGSRLNGESRIRDRRPVVSFGLG